MCLILNRSLGCKHSFVFGPLLVLLWTGHSPIVRCEEHQRILVYPAVLQHLQQVPHGAIKLKEGISKGSPG